ncbi:2-oxoglutarate/malate carrier protein [Salpingoeca rosetta]|uniref:Mitochondrial 2-oxoglutarate/malate carrier protein n=1 Tax=Salpingoeca rosetta (strain ATCC 50818 / BSB-021) TaxID=946362 RepID=F2UJE4_SALR5|nr:2-oxoglutarate/malate carrier protein [Salpingoeca rosetta]EGD77243.1 2-oxoglutarate/malate carrier protein [Salpingoeca rosetta]|eukprot:XP_004990587.1 2-oxoglutarate/malate carrier protein [Salpingoeca rosetta]
MAAVMKQKKQQPPNYAKFAFGGLAGMGATFFVQPLDLLKNRMQVAGGRVSFFTIVGNVIKQEGALALYTGLSAGLLRQATYTTTRLGVYNMLLDKAMTASDGELSFASKAGIGLTAGAVGAVVGTPAEIALIRMSSDGSRPAAERRGYTSVFNALSRIAREEGVLTLWRGCGPTVARAMVVNAAQLATYTQAKQVIKQTFELDGIGLHFSASMVSGLATTAASMPVDILKTRIQNMNYVNGVPEFKGPLHVASHIVRSEGVFALWKGFLPYYARLGPHTVLTFIILEQLNKAYNTIAA